MYRLTGIRVVNWHGYQDEIVPIIGSTLVTGQNGAGKTTLVDAIQYCLVADQRLVRFNKANQSSRRTLVGYCRWYVSAEESGRQVGRGTYQRGACTSYVALRFDHSVNPMASFVCAVILEAGDSDSLLSQHHLIVPNIGLEDLPFVDGAVPRSSLEFRRHVSALGWSTIPDAHKYKLQLRHRLGYLPESFHRMLVKSLDFKPIGEVRQFIRDYLLEERPLQTDALLRNVENYQRLEAEAAEAERRIAALEGILDVHSQYERASDEHTSMEYMVGRARVDSANERADALLADIDERWQTVSIANGEIEDHKRRETELRKDQEALFIAIAGAPEEIQRKNLVDALARASTAVEEAEAADQQARDALSVMGRTFAFVQGATASEARKREPVWFADDPFADPVKVQRCHEFLEGAGDPDGRRARSFRTALDDAYRVYVRVEELASTEITRLRNEAAHKHREREHLERGQVTYQPEVEALLHLLNSRLTLASPIRPLCEQIEMADPRWTDAAEAMLGQDRFSLVVPPEQYERAIQLYHRHKDGYHLPGHGDVAIQGVRVIDTRGVLRDVERGRGRRDGSLADQIEASNDFARAYVDYRLGDVMCVERVLDLRGHARAVTPDVMVHQGHATYRMSPNAYRRRYIGRSSQRHRIEQLAREIALAQERIDSVDGVLAFAKEARVLCWKSRVDLDSYVDVARKAQGLGALKEREVEIRRQIEQIDRDPEVRRRGEERERLERGISEHRQAAERLMQQVAAIRAGIASDEARIKALWEEAERAQRALDERFAGMPESRINGYMERYTELRERGDEPEAIATEYERQRKNRETRMMNLRDQLVAKQTDFHNMFAFERPEDVADVARYRVELQRWVESELPQNRVRIAEVREEARLQLAQDYIYRLYESFQLMKLQFADVNRALATDEANMQWGRYRLTYSPLTEYKATYDLIERVGLAGKDSLFDTETARLELGKEFDELADSLLRAGVRSVEQSVLSDYREFFDYDLILTRPDGSTESFKNVSGGGSGGENQVPYYIAIFASMYQMYRQTQRDGRPSCGLVLLDEAFSKMDEPRVEATLGLAKHLNLQLILVTPGEKVATIVPRVETTILIERDQKRSDAVPIARRFNRERLEEILESLGDEATASAVA